MTVRSRLENIKALSERMLVSDATYPDLWRSVRGEALGGINDLDEADEMYPASITGQRVGPTTHRLVPDPEETL